MKLSKRIISVLLSSLCAGTALFSSTVSAEDYKEPSEIISADIYDNTNTGESKEVSADISETTTTAVTTVSTVKTTTAATTTAPPKPFDVFSIYENHQNQVATPVPTDIPIYVKKRGIDVSEYQGDINWNEVRKNGVDFAIIKAGYGREYDQVDPYFHKNMKNAQAAGIDCGTYWYSYASTVEAAYKEADACYNTIKNYNFTYPVYFDIEEKFQESLSTAQVSAIIEAFCSTLQSKGYYVGLYSNANFLSSKVYSNVLSKYDVWVAHYGVDTPAFNGKYGMWQYTIGSANGIDGEVDLDYGYLNYPYIITGDIKHSLIDNPTISINKGLAQGIDVSVLQGKINWSQAAQSGVKYAMIRAGYGKLSSQKDKYFDINMANATAAGVKCGAYWYSYATNAADAKLEAEACYQVIKNYKFAYPIYFDLEDPSLSSLSKSELSAIADAFCSTLEAKGYFVGIMGNPNLLTNRLEKKTVSKYDSWVVQYGVNVPSYTELYGMWRYSNTAAFNGVNGRVNGNYVYVDFPNIISKAHLNGY